MRGDGLAYKCWVKFVRSEYPLVKLTADRADPLKTMLALFLMNGTQILQSQFLESVGTEFRVRGVRDCNGDGKADVIFRRNTDWMMAIVLLDGFNNLGSQLIGAVGVLAPATAAVAQTPALPQKATDASELLA